jgi:hypothetical protein
VMLLTAGVARWRFFSGLFPSKSLSFGWKNVASFRGPWTPPPPPPTES